LPLAGEGMRRCCGRGNEAVTRRGMRPASAVPIVHASLGRPSRETVLSSITIAERFARHVCEARFTDLPPAAIASCKIFILDSLGVGVAGAGLPDAARLRAAAARWGEGGEAGVFGTAARLPAPSAALVA